MESFWISIVLWMMLFTEWSYFSSSSILQSDCWSIIFELIIEIVRLHCVVFSLYYTRMPQIKSKQFSVNWIKTAEYIKYHEKKAISKETLTIIGYQIWIIIIMSL